MAGPRLSTTGLQSAAAPQATNPPIQWAVGAGTTGIITAAFSPPIKALGDGAIVGVRLSATNTTTTPTFNADGTGPHVIVKNFNEALEPGDLPSEAWLRLDIATGTWVLENPATMWREITEWAAAGGTVDAITAAYTPAHGVLRDGMIFGVRAGGANATTTSTFAPDTQVAERIYKLGKQTLAIGDIFGANHEIILRYHFDVTTPWYELLNPAQVIDPTFGVKFCELTADATTLADDTSAHPIVGLGVTLAAGTYSFKGKLHTTRVAGTTSHTTSFLFGGTAVLTRIDFVVRARTGDAIAQAAVDSVRFSSAAAVVVKAASTSATEDVDLEIEGVVVVGTAGTLLPEMQYSVATGGVTTPKAGSYFEYAPKTNPQGTWA